MVDVKKISCEELEAAVTGAGAVLPIEQTEAWARFQATVPGRTPWGALAVEEGGKPLAYVSFTDYETHGYHFLRSHHGPTWLSAPDAETERAAVCAIRDYVHQSDHKVVFLRMAVDAELDVTRPVLSTVPYDTTVVVDLSGGDEEILKRMKPRGRRDVRKALREAPVECYDETDKAIESFEEYYPIMEETGQRDGFAPAPIEEYHNMISLLGPDRCRLFVGRETEGNRVVTWEMDTISGKRATRYFAASRNETMRMHVTDKLVYSSCCMLAELGCEDFDLMAIGSELAPSLMGLNEFKTKFAKEGVIHLAPDRDVPVRGAFYSSLQLAKKVRG